MKKNYIFIVVLTILITVFFTLTVAAINSETTTTSEVYIPSEPIFIETKIENFELEDNLLSFINTNDKDELQRLMKECEERKESSHKMAEAARQCGYLEDHLIIKLAIKEWQNAEELYNRYSNIYEEILYEEKMNKYPVATEIWFYLKDFGYNDYVCAGIMGNIMAEVGGQTLEIQPYISGNGYYGICQWNEGYKEKVWGASLEDQCLFLNDTIEYEIDTFGFCYKTDFDFNDFLQMTDEREVALAFAKCYERCSSLSYYTRQENAEIAYEYFAQK